MKPNIELHIEKLVLHGFAPADRHRIGKSAKRELVRLLAGQDVPQLLTNGSEISQIEGGAFEVDPSSKAEVIGAQLARAVYGGFGR